MDGQSHSYFLRSRIAENENMSNITLTVEQFETLLGRLNINQNSPVTTGNFSKCSSRFDGSKGSDVSAFIDAIEVYKDCTGITDENALKGLPMLLDSFAAKWFQGVKASVTSWQDAVSLLRNTFGPLKPPYRVYRELFAEEQDSKTKTDVFICKTRSILAQLPSGTLTEAVQLDMVYGLLHRKIREKVPRDKINSFNELLTQARLAEETFDVSCENKDAVPSKKRCNYCNHLGHIKSECRKFAKENNTGELNYSRDSAKSLNESSQSTLRGTPPKIACYGCGSQGFIRSNCPKCNAKTSADSNSIMSTEFMCNSFDDTSNAITRPLVPIKVYGHNGFGFIDTGAKTSVAGSMLAKILLKEEVPYSECNLLMTLADGVQREVQAQIFEVPVTLQHKIVQVRFVSVPEHVASRTLLGVDFVTTANIILNIPEKNYYFRENPSKVFTFNSEMEVKCSINTINFDDIVLRKDEGVSLKTEEREDLDHLLSDFAELFATSDETTPFAEHTIPLLDENPISMPPYRLPEPKKQLLREELDKLLQDGVIEECESPYAAPVVLVPKKDGKIRLTVDYRGINAVTRPDRYPLPRLDDLLHEAKQSKYMSTLDLKSGYHQISVKETDRDKTAFTTPFGTYRFIRMPFGLRNAPATFQRLMNKFKAGLLNVFILVYLDDIIIISPSFSEHINDLKAVFERLIYFKLRLNRQKCFFSCDSVRYLGHIISSSGIQPDPDKVCAIKQMKPPSNVKQLLSFFQTCSWFRRFIPDFARVTKPLSTLLKKSSKWAWGPDQDEAFQSLKELLSTSPILRQADPHLPYILRTDASGYALGACLLQGEGPDERPVEYASRLLTSAEVNYSTTEREALGVVWAVKKFRGYLEGAVTVVQTDHQPLKWLMSLKSPSGRLARWSLSLQEFDLRIDYISGRCNVIADTLSRPIVEETLIATITIDLPTISPKDLRQQQLEDPELNKIIVCLENPTTEVDFKKWSERGFLMCNGVLYKFTPDIDEEEPQLVAPKSRIPKILHDYHDADVSGHYGVEKTIQRISGRYYWPGMRRTITEHVRKCLECQRYKTTNLKPGGVLQTPVPAQRFEVISIDLFGPLPEASTGERWILTVEDYASRWIELFALADAKAETCAKCLINEIILRYGVPRRVISDNGVQFVGALMQQVAHVLGFQQSLIPVYHPESNPIERRHRDVKTQLAILTNGDHASWKDKLAAVRFSMNTAHCESTDFTPAYLTFGRELRTPDDVSRDLRAIIAHDNFATEITPYLRIIADTLNEAKENHMQAQDKWSSYKNQHRRPTTFSVGDHVLVESHLLSKAKDAITAKFSPKRDGPYEIVKVVTPTTYVVASPKDPSVPLGKYHASALYPFVGDMETEPVRPIRKRGRPANKPTTEPEGENLEGEEEGNQPGPVDDSYDPDSLDPAPDALAPAADSPQIDIVSDENCGRPRRRTPKSKCPCCPP